MTRPIVKSFHAILERLSSRLNWVVIRIPLDVPKIWGTRGRLRVKGEINGFAFRTSLFPTGKGDHIMLVKQTDAVRRQSRSRYRRAVPPGARHRSTRRHRTRRTEARPGRGPLAPPSELLHTQGNRRLDHPGEKRRSP